MLLNGVSGVLVNLDKETENSEVGGWVSSFDKKKSPQHIYTVCIFMLFYHHTVQAVPLRIHTRGCETLPLFPLPFLLLIFQVASDFRARCLSCGSFLYLPGKFYTYFWCCRYKIITNNNESQEKT